MSVFDRKQTNQTNSQNSQEIYEFKISNGTILSIKQQNDSLNHGTTIWDSSIITAQFMQHFLRSSNNSLINKKCIELGSGCGLLGLVMCSMGLQTTLTDLECVVVNILQDNVKRNLWILNQHQQENNNSLLNAQVKILDWTVTKLQPPEFTPPYDYIVATDCIYSLDLINHFVRCINELSNEKSLIFCGLERRDPLVTETFVNACKGGFNVVKIPEKKLKKFIFKELDDDIGNINVEIYRLKKRK
ncbi:putative methyltransferase-domain-containing protein [Glomus cerebriforme]|uniref:Putative methyltransferase-domain-containing protein n=1 Tax=Glomus cerebriforme TaxID=658196 RepID=A0A397SFD8_9GLOM|nr:putative methyltransferase-domain-containing protein [Glomus cerebriforme]